MMAEQSAQFPPDLDEDVDISQYDGIIDLATQPIQSVKTEQETRPNSLFNIDTTDTINVPASTGGDELNITPDVNVETFDYDAIAVNMIQFQVEHHFSDENLALDNRMLTKLHQDPEYWVSIKSLLAINQVSAITEDPEVVKKAVRKSEILTLNDEETKVKRKNFVPPKPRHHKNMRRTVFVYGLSDGDNVNTVRDLCQAIGQVNAIVFDDGKKYILNTKAIKAGDLDMIDREVAIAIMTRKFGPQAVRSNSAHFGDALSPSQTSAWLQMEQKRVSSDISQEDTMTKSLTLQIPDSSQAPGSPVFVHPIPNPNGDPLDFSHLKACFVVFQSQSFATKFVKSRARAADGIRALQQYEYIKYRKKLCMNKARGISALISPKSIGLALNSPTYAILGAMRRPSGSSIRTDKSPTFSPQPASPMSPEVHFNASYNLEPVQRSPSSQGTQAMEYFLGNYREGSPMVVPEAVAGALAHEFQQKLSLNPPSNTTKTFRRHTAPHGNRQRSSKGKGRKYQAPRRSAGNVPHQPMRQMWNGTRHGPPRYHVDRKVGRSWDHWYSNQQSQHPNMSGAGPASPQTWDYHNEHHQNQGHDGQMQAPMQHPQSGKMNNGNWRRTQKKRGNHQNGGSWRRRGGQGGQKSTEQHPPSYNVMSNAPYYPTNGQQYAQ